MKKTMFRPIQFARRLLEKADGDSPVSDEFLRQLAKRGAQEADDMFPLPGKLGALVDMSNLDRKLFEVVLYVVLHEIRGDDEKAEAEKAAKED